MTTYNENTNEKVIEILENAINMRKRIRVFYGDTETGRDWLEEYGTIGKIGRSCGEKKVPLLLANERSNYGGPLLDDCIVKITIDKTIVYRHELCNLPSFMMQADAKGERVEVLANGKLHATFKTFEQARKFIQFLKGERNAK